MGVDGARPSQWREQSDFPPPPQDACSLTLIHPQTSWCGLGRRQGDPHLPLLQHTWASPGRLTPGSPPTQ